MRRPRRGARAPKLLTYQDVAALYAIPAGTLRYWVHKHRVPHLRVGECTVRFEPRAIDAWFTAKRVAAQQGAR